MVKRFLPGQLISYVVIDGILFFLPDDLPKNPQTLSELRFLTAKNESETHVC